MREQPSLSNHTDFTNRQLARLIGPLMLEQLLAITVGFADSLMVSTVGNSAMSAVSLVDSINSLMMYIFISMAAGGAAVAGQYLGRRAQEDAREAGQHLILFLGVISLAITAVLYLFEDWLVALLFGKISPDIMASVHEYYHIVVAAIPFLALYNAGAALFRMMGKSNVTLCVSLLMNVVNVGGNALLIFGLGMDVKGVAIPTLLSRAVAAAIILGMLRNKKLPLNLNGIAKLRYRPLLMKNILYIGLPSGIENGMIHLGRLALFSLISTFGDPSIAANAVANTMSNFCFFAGQAVGLSMATVISPCCGAGEFDKARGYMKKFVCIAYSLVICSNIIVIALIPRILFWYRLTGQAAHLARIILLMHCIASAAMWVPAFAIPYFLRAAGDARFSMVVSMITMWGIRVLFAYILGKGMGYGLIGVWFSHTVLDWVVRTVVFVRRYAGGAWKAKAIL